MSPTVADEIARYLCTGDTDTHHRAWPSDSFMTRALQARDDLRGSLVAEVLRRTERAPVPDLPTPEQLAALVRRKTEPMVRGLFPLVEQDAVLALVERSVIILTPANIATTLHKESFDHAAWDLANLYLGSFDAELLGPDAPQILGISDHTTCYVTPSCLDEDEPFADYIVHEVAHIFHNCKRETVGLPHTRRREWLLDIEYRKRETFAYACEAFSRIVERARKPGERAALVEAFAVDFRPSESRIDAAEVSDILREAASGRNGWRRILDRCAPARQGDAR
jgi:hypothetical protein